MSNHTGSIWSNVTDGANRRKGPGQNFDKVDNLPARTSLIVLCWSRGQSETWTTPALPHCAGYLGYPFEKIGMVCMIDQVSLLKHVRCEYNERDLFCSYACAGYIECPF